MGKGHVTDFNNNENLIFKGELINGEKNGKEKEYNFSGGFNFDGEYLKGKKWKMQKNKGKIFDI